MVAAAEALALSCQLRLVRQLYGLANGRNHSLLSESDWSGLLPNVCQSAKADAADSAETTVQNMMQWPRPANSGEP